MRYYLYTQSLRASYLLRTPYKNSTRLMYKQVWSWILTHHPISSKCLSERSSTPCYTHYTTILQPNFHSGFFKPPSFPSLNSLSCTQSVVDTLHVPPELGFHAPSTQPPTLSHQTHNCCAVFWILIALRMTSRLSGLSLVFTHLLSILFLVKALL